MNILANFNDSLTEYFEKVDKLAISSYSELLKTLDDELFKSKPKYLKSIKISSRSILTTKGYVTFKRRYYYDESIKKYYYLLDLKLKISKYKKLSDELVLKIMNRINETSYRKIGKTIVPNHVISKSTIYRAIKNTQIYLDEKQIKIKEFSGNVHLQIDEKYLRIRGFPNKIPLYTCCMFTDKLNVGTEESPRNKLVNKIIYGTFNMKDFIDEINYCLKNIYHVSESSEIFLSGDLAQYIRSFKNKIYVCKAKYIPDKWHVLKSINDLMRYCNMNKYDKDLLLNTLKTTPKARIINQGQSYIIKLIKTHDDIEKIWKIDRYLGCCQECINSHHYSQRFYRTSNFSKETVEKINLIELSKCIDVKPKIGIRKSNYVIPKIHYKPSFDDIDKTYNVNLNSFTLQTRKLLANMIFGSNT